MLYSNVLNTLNIVNIHSREMNLRAEEDRCSRLREELLTVREDLSKTYLTKDMLEQQKSEVEALLAQVEKSRGMYSNVTILYR